MGWLPDFVFAGDKFEAGLAFFADALGRISRFSREPADLAIARKLPGQVALPGLVNGHASSWHRLLRGRDATAAALTALGPRLTPEDLLEVARLTFTELMLSGVTCVGEFCDWPAGEEGRDAGLARACALAVVRAAHETGIRISLFPVAAERALSSSQAAGSTIDAFVRETEALRTEIARSFPADEAWLAVAAAGANRLSRDSLKALATYAHAQRLRLQVPVAATREDVAESEAQHGRTPIAWLAEQGLVDKRFTAVHAAQATSDECRILGAARASVCCCATPQVAAGRAVAPIPALLAAGAGVALGTGSPEYTDLLKDARLLEFLARTAAGRSPGLGPNPAALLFNAATVGGARSLGATGGALEVGRPADFFTVNLFDPALAGVEPGSLLSSLVFGLERRAVREVWIGARPKIAGGRHPNQGPIVGRFVDVQRRLLSGG